jgi:hypothetical protein
MDTKIGAVITECYVKRYVRLGSAACSFDFGLRTNRTLKVQEDTKCPEMIEIEFKADTDLTRTVKTQFITKFLVCLTFQVPNTTEHNLEFAPGSQVRLIAQLHAKLVVPQSFVG